MVRSNSPKIDVWLARLQQVRSRAGDRNYVVNMQKTLHKQRYTPIILDAIRKHQKEATLPKFKSLYHKTSGIYPENKC